MMWGSGEDSAVASRSANSDQQTKVDDNSVMNSDEPLRGTVAGVPEDISLNAKGYLQALKSGDETEIGRYVWLKVDGDEKYVGEDGFFSHRGVDTKKELVAPLAKLQRELYGHKIFVDCEPVNERSRSSDVDKANILRKSLWKCPVIVIFLSRHFHESEWCLRELYTTLYRKHCDDSVAVRVVFCEGMDPGLCKKMEEYAGLDLGWAFGTLYKAGTTYEGFVVDYLHPMICQLINGDSAEVKPVETVRTKWRQCSPLKPPDASQDADTIFYEAIKLNYSSPASALDSGELRGYKEAAGLGHLIAKVRYGLVLRILGRRQDADQYLTRENLRLIEQGADDGDSIAMVTAAEMHIYKVAENCSNARALKWVTDATEQNHTRPVALFVAALVSLQIGDRDEGKVLLQAAADAGNVKAAAYLEALLVQERTSS